MSLVLVRVDCRLIHGQIIEAWVPFTRANCLIVANDEAANDFLQRSIMEMAVPPTVEIAIHEVQEAARLLSQGKWSGKRAILLFANCSDALLSYETGLNYSSLNIGNIACSSNIHQVTCSLSIDQTDLEHLHAIRRYGIQVEARAVPQDSSVSILPTIGPDHKG